LFRLLAAVSSLAFVSASPEAGAAAGHYESYNFALNWQPQWSLPPYCDEKLVSKLSGAYAASHMGVHGLWPNYDPAQHNGKSWPQFCRRSNGEDFTDCDNHSPPAHCAPTIAAAQYNNSAQWQTYAMEYAWSGLATHEWSKHGSCTPWDQITYFKHVEQMYQRLQHGNGAQFVTANVGKQVNCTDLLSAFKSDLGGHTVGIKDHSCRLSEIWSNWNADPVTLEPTTPYSYEDPNPCGKCDKLLIMDYSGGGVCPAPPPSTGRRRKSDRRRGGRRREDGRRRKGGTPDGHCGDLALNPGDVVVVGLNSRPSTSVTIATMVDLVPGQCLTITDNGWTGTELSSNEGQVRCMVKKAVVAGSIWSFPSQGTDSVRQGNIDCDGSSSFALSTKGDSLLLYTGDSQTPHFLHGVANRPWMTGTGSINSHGSYLPRILLDSKQYISLCCANQIHYNFVYRGPLRNMKSQLLEFLGTGALWGMSNDQALFMKMNTHFAITPSPSGIVSIAAYAGGSSGVAGTAIVTSTSTGIRIVGTLTGLEANLTTPVAGVANSNGYHIHSGSSCESGTAAGGHYCPGMAADPWTNVSYTSSSCGYATIDISLAGFSLNGSNAVSGRAFVVHDSSGARVACGLIQVRPALFVDVAQYAGLSTGIAGTMAVVQHSNDPSVQLVGTLTGLAPNSSAATGVANSDGYHVHENPTCSSGAAAGGHYTAGMGPDPWSNVSWQSDGRGAAQLRMVMNNFSLAGMNAVDGRAMVIHDGTGARAACGLISTTEAATVPSVVKVCTAPTPIPSPSKTETNHEHQREVFVQSIPATIFGILLLGLSLGGMVVGIKRVAAGMNNPRPDGDVVHVTLDEAEKDLETM